MDKELIMNQKIVSGFNYTDNVRNLLLSVALRLFTQKGIAAVSLLEIAQDIGIAKADIYQYYQTKEALIDDILKCFISEYSRFLEKFSAPYPTHVTLESVLDRFFSIELPNSANMLIYLGMSLVNREQYTNALAKWCTRELLYGQTVLVFKTNFDTLIDRGIIPPSYTNLLSLHIMMWLISLNDLRLHEYFEEGIVDNTELLFYDMRHKISKLLSLGV
ncbi:MAG: TetR/AcrR family transcriptional regulator [Oscillospiraceae bacterium]|nr:TetR/AcrR family transcriptional regulator [Oscillospiraceae bacterium]